MQEQFYLLEHSQQRRLLTVLDHIDDIIAEKEGKELWFPCENVAEDKENTFEFNKVEYMNILLHTEKILAIVHSHTDETVEPSEHDRKVCNFIKIPYLIVNWPDKEIKLVNPGDYE